MRTNSLLTRCEQRAVRYLAMRTNSLLTTQFLGKQGAVLSRYSLFFNENELEAFPLSPAINNYCGADARGRGAANYVCAGGEAAQVGLRAQALAAGREYFCALRVGRQAQRTAGEQADGGLGVGQG